MTAKKLIKANTDAIYELSLTQQGMLFSYLSEPNKNLYNAQLQFEIQGDFDVDVFRKSLALVQSRNEALRSVFRWEKLSKPIQVVLKACDIDFVFQDISGYTSDGVARFLEEYLAADQNKVFDLTVLPLRMGLVKIALDRYRLTVTHHHILYDGWSTGIFCEELFGAYKQIKYGHPPVVHGKPALKEIYEAMKTKADQAKNDMFWKGYLEGYEVVLLLTQASPKSSTKEHIEKFNWKTPFGHLDTFAREHRVTKAAVVYAAFGLLLHKYSQATDIVFGTTVSNRDYPVAGIERVIGNFINTIPLRIQRLGSDSFLQTVTQVNNDLIKRSEYNNTAYFEIKKLLGLDHTRDLFDAVLVIENYPVDEAGMNSQGDFQVKVKSVYENTGIPLVVVVVFGPEVEIEVIYDTQVLDGDYTRALGNHFMDCIHEVVTHAGHKPDSFSLLSDDEREFVLHELNDTRAFYPKTEPVTSLVDAQAIKTPQRIALRYGRDVMSYQALRALSDSLACYLRRQKGVQTGDLVGVMLERDPHLIVSILGVLKAGAAYVPIDRGLPVDRVNSILQESGLKVLITAGEFLRGVDQSTLQIVELKPDWSDVQADEDQVSKPDLQSNDLAYVLFTSGSTGKPKGVLVEHGALTNYIWWAAGMYVSTEKTTFPFWTSVSFDLTLTSIFVPLITSNEMIIYAADDAGLLIDKMVSDNAIHALKLTPSHLKILNASLSTELCRASRLRTLIVGGEDLPTSLAREIHDKFEGRIEIYNEYGPTEATVGCMIHKFDVTEETQSVPLGHPISNTQIYLLDRSLSPVPAGVTGELYVAGDGLARGYLYNAAMTDQRFIASPFVSGALMYKTGDYAVRLANNRICFLGRTDDQVKINGFRVELAEVETQLMAYPQVREAVVIIKEKDGSKFLVAYYVSAQEIDAALMMGFMRSKLPHYMIPSFYVRLEKIPLGASGKLDKRALPIETITVEHDHIVPDTAEEKLLARVWADVLKIERVGVTDNFFLMGGDSIKSIQISSRMRMEDYQVSVRDLLTFPTIRELAVRCKKVRIAAAQSPVVGQAPLTSIQRWFFEGSIVSKHHYNQSLLLNLPEQITAAVVQKVFQKIVAHHDALRIVIRWEDGEPYLFNEGTNLPVSCETFDLTNESDEASRFLSIANQLQTSFNLEDGPLLKLGLFQVKDGSRLLMVAHHLVIDAVSWRIIGEDMASLLKQINKGEPLELPLKTDSFLSWSKYLQEYARSREFEKSVAYWDKVLTQEVAPLKRDNPEGKARVADGLSESFALDDESTWKLLHQMHHAFGAQVNDVLLTALVLAIAEQFDMHHLRLDLEGHGREHLAETLDINRTVGWFTSIYPVFFELGGNEIPRVLKHVKETLRSVPNGGLDYLLARNLDVRKTQEKWWRHSSIVFNYLGQFDSPSAFVAAQSKGDEVSPDEYWWYDLDIAGMVAEGQLQVVLRYAPTQYHPDTIRAFMQSYQRRLEAVIAYCCACETRELTPSDITLRELPAGILDHLQRQYALQDVYTLSPMQEGMLFHYLLDPESEHYRDQKTLSLRGRLDVQAMKKSLEDVADRYDVLRTLFLHDAFERPLQLVLKKARVNFTFIDLRKDIDSKDKAVAAIQAQDRQRKFSLSTEPALRTMLIQTAENEYELIWSHHHIIMDGWCSAIIWNDLRNLYRSNTTGIETPLPAVKKYAYYINWLENREKEQSQIYWQEYLKGYDQQAALPLKATSAKAGDFSVRVHSLKLEDQLMDKMHEVSRANGVTLNTIMQCAWALLLGKYAGVDDVVFGLVSSVRPTEIPGVETMVGLFLNTVPVRITYTPQETVADLLGRVQKSALEKEPYQYLPLSAIQTLTGVVFDNIMIFENYPISDELLHKQPAHATSEDFVVTQVQAVEQTNYDLALFVIGQQNIEIRFDYNPAVYSPEVIEGVSTHLNNILHDMVSIAGLKVGDLEMLDSLEKHRLLEEFSGEEISLDEGDTIVSLFADQVLKSGEATALIFGEKAMSYRELHKRSNQLAQVLLSKGVNTEDRIGIMMPRCQEMIISILAVLKSGCCYVPLDPDYPADRLRYIMEDSELRLLLTQGDAGQIGIGDDDGVERIDVNSHIVLEASRADVHCRFTGNNLAYLIYTSGSTGTPKGVMIEHGHVVNFIKGVSGVIGFEPGSRIVNLTTISFDIFVLETLVPLASGMAVIITNAEEQRDARLLSGLVSRHKGDMLQITPSHLRLLLTSGEGHSLFERISTIMIGGEALPVELLEELRRQYSGRIYNMYGPTETTVWSTIKDLSEAGKMTIGSPMVNTTIRILGKDSRLQGIGIPGEICIGGAGVSRGYWKQPVLSRDKFITDPVMGAGRIYRTGDLGRWLPNGEIEFLGRLDYQVKLRGFRIELGEIESVLLRHEQINEAVVSLIDKGADKYLVGYYVSETELGEEALRSYLMESLPDYMVPAQYIRLDRLPLTPNGKLDRKSLPDPGAKGTALYTAPRTQQESLLATVWGEVLGQAQVGISDNFFSIGGDSIKSIQISSRLRRLGYEVSVKDIMRSLTIERLSSRLRDLPAVGYAPNVSAGSPAGISHRGLTADQLNDLREKYDLEDVYSLSPMQEGMLFHSLLDARSNNYLCQTTCRIKGKLDIRMIERTINDLIDRHHILRTAFLHEGYEHPIQVVLKQRRIVFDYKDVREECRVLSVDDLMRRYQPQDKVLGLDLSKDSLMRLMVLQVSDEEFMLVWHHHHVLMDGWSMSIVVHEFKSAYSSNMQAVPWLPPAAVPYAAYIHWQQTRDKAGDSAFWRSYLESYDTLATFPGKEQGSASLPYKQEFFSFVIQQDLVKVLHEISARYHVTMNIVFQCAWAILLGKYNNVNDVVFGSVISGRPPEIEGIEAMVGLFIGTIPIRIQYQSADTVGQLFEEVRDKSFEYEKHQYHPLSEIQPLSSTQNDLFDHILIFESFPDSGMHGPDGLLEISDVKYSVQTNYDLNVTIVPGEAVAVHFDYDANRYDKAIISQIASHFQNVLTSIVKHPESKIKEVSVYSADEQVSIRETLSHNLELGLGIETIQAMLDRSFSAHGQNIAIEYRDRHYSYFEIERTANRIANALGNGFPPGSYVGIFCEDRHWLICAILGILKSGNRFVPLETGLPTGRLLSIMGQVDLRCVITDQNDAVRDKLTTGSDAWTWLAVDEIGELPEDGLKTQMTHAPEDLVYVYFTSGSTGTPKGIVGRNKGLAHFITWEIKTFGVDPAYRFSQFTNPGFDVFMRDMFVPLCAGATVCIPDANFFSSGEEISHWIDEKRITLIHCVPSFFRLINTGSLSPEQFQHLKYVLLAGEKILPYELRNWYTVFWDRIQLVNIYGPTETTLAKGCYLIQPENTDQSYLPVQAIPGAQFLILDNDLNVCPEKVLGEIYVRTPYRTSGYLHNEALNESKFLRNPFSSDNDDWIYKTGDLGRHEHGLIEIVGRVDHQVKIRGIRIELDDIKENILKYPDINDAVVVVKEDSDAVSLICAYIVYAQSIDLSKLRLYLEGVLPGNMIPSYFVVMDRLPLMPNGKIDRRALPEPDLVREENLEAPVNEVEKTLLEIWSEVLKIDGSLISTHKSFFEMGGDSLRVMQLINKVNKNYHAGISLKDVFEKKSIRNIADYLITVKQIDSTSNSREIIEVMV